MSSSLTFRLETKMTYNIFHYNYYCYSMFNFGQAFMTVSIGVEILLCNCNFII